MGFYFDEMTVDRYLSENLPPGEESIPEPMDPDCKVCVVIPCYGERKYILRPLLSLSRQKEVTPRQFEVIIVVNNPGTPPGKAPGQSDEAYKQKLENWNRIRKDNRETLEFLRYIKEPTPALQLDPREAQSAAEILQWGLRVYAVDKSSPAKTLPTGEANVGGARNRGMAEGIQRFYKQGKNGVIAFTDGDTWMEENFIVNLIKVFEQNPSLVGVAGVDEDVLESPYDSDMMKDHIGWQAKKIYLSLLYRLFFDEPLRQFIPFIGSNMAVRAYEAARTGGIPKAPGHEDTELALKMAEIGVVKKVDDVINFPIMRYSSRTTSGKGLSLETCSDENLQIGTILVRSMEAAFVLSATCKKLKQARKDNRYSPGELRRILTLDQQDSTLLSQEDLTSLSQLMPRFHTCRWEFLTVDLKTLIEKIFVAVDAIFPPQPITKAWEILKNVYFKNNQVKNRYETVKTTMIRQVDQTLTVLEFILEQIYSLHTPTQQQNSHDLVTHLHQLTRENHTPLLQEIFAGKPYRLERMATLISSAKTPRDALHLLKVNFMTYLAHPQDDPLLSLFIELQALYDTLAILDGFKPGK